MAFPWAFVHIPRNSGTSVRQMLKQLNPPDGMGYIWPEKRGHLPASYLAKRYKAAWPELKTFSVCRNPFDRLVSLFGYYHNKSHWPNTAQAFQDWVRAGFAQPPGCAPMNLFHGEAMALPLHAPQVAWLRDWNPSHPRGAPRWWDNPWMVAEIFRFEELNTVTGWARLMEYLEVPEPYPVRDRVNMSQRQLPTWEHYYDRETRCLVRRLYRDDFEGLGYG